jgi:HAD superfamily hydrolase (TIGR01662 family)
MTRSRKTQRRGRSSVTHIYFDWSGTLAHKKSREQFIAAASPSAKRATLFPETMPTLKELHDRGFTIGIISNTSNSPVAFKKALRDAGLARYLRGALITNRPGLCRKPCRPIFTEALSQDGVSPQNAIMVGDKYAKDIVGGKRMGMRTFHRTRKNPVSRLLRSLTRD